MLTLCADMRLMPPIATGEAWLPPAQTDEDAIVTQMETEIKQMVRVRGADGAAPIAHHAIAFQAHCPARALRHPHCPARALRHRPFFSLFAFRVH